MCIKKTVSWTCAVLIFMVGQGCGKSGSNGSAHNTARRANTNEPIATIHWVGAKHLAGQANAAGFLKIWRLPETEKLRAQTLDKLALAPWTQGATNQTTVITNTSPLVRANASAALLRPLLEDLVEEECYLEIRDPGAAGCQLALAVRLDPKHAATWENNLGSVFETATGSRRTQTPGNKGWNIQAGNSSQSIATSFRHAELTRVGDWTIFGLAPEQNPVFAELSRKIQGNPNPFPMSGATNLLQLTCDLRRLCAALAWGPTFPEDAPTIALALSGDGPGVVTRGQLTFDPKVPFEIEPWIIPTNLIHEPLHSFTAVQGLKTWISSSHSWESAHAGPAPNQLFCWAQAGSPFLEYAAAALDNASSAVQKIGPKLEEEFNPVLASNRTGQWERTASGDGEALNRAPIINPFIKSVTEAQGHFLLSGLTALAITNTRPPSGTLHDLLSRKNVVYFDREITGPRVESLMFVSQLFRIILRREQLPTEAAAVQWLKVLGPLLGDTSTTITKTSQNTLSFERKSTFGFTGIEYHLMADWLESARFPFDLHTAIAKLPPHHTGNKVGPASLGPKGTAPQHR